MHTYPTAHNNSEVLVGVIGGGGEGGDRDALSMQDTSGNHSTDTNLYVGFMVQ